MSFLFNIHFIFVLIFYFFFEAQVVARNRLRKTKRTQDEYSEVVLNKKYPKKNKIEISVPTIGYIFNQSYINSIMLQGAISQYRNEEWGLSLDVAKFINEDKYERYCLERFYNDFLFKLDQFCPEVGQDPVEPITQGSSTVSGTNFGPAYVPIVELESIAMLSGVWTPTYGKVLIASNILVYLDFFLSFNAGVAKYKYYPLMTTLKNGKKSRQSSIEYEENNVPACTQIDVGICPEENYEDFIGENGRPEAESKTSPIVSLGIGQKFHFGKYFNLKVEFRTYNILSLDQGVGTYVSGMVGLGVRLL